MANFNTHLTGGFAVSALLGLVIYKTTLIDTPEFLLCVLLGTAGGLLPDIDSDHSIPIKLGFDLASLAVAFGAIIQWRGELSLLSMLLLWFVSYAFVRYGVFSVFTRLTVHRGMIHSVPFVFLAGLMLVCTSHYLLGISSITSWFYGLFLTVGALVHLTLDEMYSVDLLNQRLKRSSGTAMKFYKDSQRYHYVGLYALLALFLIIAPPVEPFWRQVSDPVTWWLLKDSLLPAVFMR